MALFIQNPDVEKSARKLARITGESLTEATQRAIDERLARLQPANRSTRAQMQLEKDLMRIARQCASLPDLDTRMGDEILGYEAEGLPGRNHKRTAPVQRKRLCPDRCAARRCRLTP